MVSPGSPVPVATSSTISSSFRFSILIISSLIGFRNFIFMSSHFFHPAEDLFHASFCTSLIFSSCDSIFFILIIIIGFHCRLFEAQELPLTFTNLCCWGLHLFVTLGNNRS